MFSGRSKSGRCWVVRSTKTDPIHILRRNLVLGGPPEAAQVVEQSVHIVHCAHPGQCSSPWQGRFSSPLPLEFNQNEKSEVIKLKITKITKVFFNTRVNFSCGGNNCEMLMTVLAVFVTYSPVSFKISVVHQHLKDVTNTHKLPPT